MVSIVEQRMLLTMITLVTMKAHISGFKSNVKKCYHIEEK